MGTIDRAINILSEAGKTTEISGYIDMNDPQTKATPENPAIVVVGIGKWDYESLKKDVEKKCKDLEKLAKRGDFKFLYKQMGKLDDFSTSYESPLQAYIRTLIQVEAKMASGAYKRKITLAKRQR
jgi:hypothetical protein